MDPSEDQAPMSIVAFLCTKEDQSLLDSWSRMLEIKSIPLLVRKECDWWFMKCYQYRRDLDELRQEISPELAITQAENLFKELDREVKGITKMKLQAESIDELTWVKNAISCVEEEIVLMEEYRKKVESQQQEVNKQKRLELDAKVCRAKEKYQEIRVKIDELKTKQESLKETEHKQQEKMSYLNDFNSVMSADIPVRNGRNGMKTLQDRAEKYMNAHNYNDEMKKLNEKIEIFKKELFGLFHGLCPFLDSVKSSLCEEVKKWMDEFKHFYVELGEKPELNELVNWCGELVKVIHDSSVIMDEWANLVPAEQQTSSCHKQSLLVMLQDFLRRTSLLTEQDGYIVKVDKKNLPKFSVRVLAADAISFELKVEAFFLLEDDINSCWNGNKLNLQLLKQKSTKLDHAVQTVKSLTGRKKNHCEAVFKDLQFKDKKFNRPGKKAVHDEKYRVVFHVHILDTEAIILSLPLVVTTGANQNCLALASTMWQCFSTDVYATPIQQPMDLPWTKLAEMLQKKMVKLCPNRQLNDDNLRHLKRRLLHDENLPDDTLVSFKRFSEDNMPMANKKGDSCCSFSFWKWFLANYNLLEKYMLCYWKENLIEGYLSREDAERKLKECRSFKPGVFILRFSDNNIVNSQGIKSVFGTLTAIVQSIYVENGEQKKRLNHLDLGGHNKQKDKTLANILNSTYGKDSHTSVFQYIYPGKHRREDTFDKHCLKGAITDGYTGIVDQFVVDLEQAMEALTISTGKHRSPSCDSESVVSVISNASSKRSRGSSDQCPTITKLLQGPRSGDFSDSQSDVLSNISSPQHPFSPQDASSDFSNMQITPPMNGKTSTVSTATLQDLNFQPLQGVGTQIPTVVPENMNTCFAPVTMAATTSQFSCQTSMHPNQPFYAAHAPSPDNEVEIGWNSGAQNMPLGSVPNNSVPVAMDMEASSNDGWHGGMDNTPDDFIHMSSSSGSISGLQLNFNELADLNVDSGSIDTNVFESDINSGNTL